MKKALLHLLAFRLSSLCLLLTGCQWSYNQVEAGHATATMVDALVQRGIPKAEQPQLDCHMLQISRDFTCRFEQSAVQLKALTQKLAVFEAPIKFSKFRYFYSAYPHNCENQLSAAAKLQFFEPLEKYQAGLEGLRYLTVYYDPQSQQACLHAGHSYNETREER